MQLGNGYLDAVDQQFFQFLHLWNEPRLVF